jgi:glycosyltransferase involved in cell wall biosynthesis
MVQECHHVTAGNSYLACLALRARAARVSVVPTTVDLDRYLRAPETRDEVRVLGWIGGRWTLPYLEQLRDPLALLTQTEGVRVRVIADQPGRMGATRSEWVSWDSANEIQELKRLTVGLAPLPDDLWTRGKCGVRLLQYLAAGVPAVASPVGTQAELTAEGAALAARSAQEWVEAVRSLLESDSMRRRVAARGLAAVRKGYDAARWGPELAGLWCGMGRGVTSLATNSGPA